MKIEIIYTEHYALIVSDSEPINMGDSIYDIVNKEVHEANDEWNNDTHPEWAKVIAHRPLTDAPILEGVSLLPEWNVSDEELLVPFPNSTQTGRLRDGSEIKTWMLGWEEGFKEAKETYKYTEEDLIKAIELAQTPSDYDSFPLIDEVIQSLQQIKRPQYFECRMDTARIPYGDDGWKTIETGIKTITNSQNQTELVGEYIF